MALAQKVVSLEDHKEKVMGKPQIEDGYTRIANELLEAILSFGFTGRQLHVVMAVIRKTYGYNKKSDQIGLSQFRDITGIDRKHVSHVLQELSDMGVIVMDENSYHARTISLNKEYFSWKNSSKNAKESLPKYPQNGDSIPKLGISPNRVIEYPQNGDTPIPNLGTTKERFKESKQKTDKPLSGKPDDSAKILDHLNQTAGTNYRPVKANLSLIESRLKEGATVEDLIRVIDCKTAEWKADPKMSAYLRPKTLFNATNFSSYVGAVAADEKPKTIGGMKVGKNWCM